MDQPKIATCCYCGTRAALTFGRTGRVELACRACGAPISVLKPLRPTSPPPPTPTPRKPPAKPTPATATAPRPRKKKKTSQKRRRGGLRATVSRLIDDLDDLLDDVLDDLLD